MIGQRNLTNREAPVGKTATSDAGLVSAETAGDAVAIVWRDGRASTFHHVWLRDNCRCSRCG